MGSGIIFQFLFATMALYTNYLLVSLHAQYRRKIDTDLEHPQHGCKSHIVSYHEIMEDLIGKWAGKVALTCVFFGLVGLSVVQIVATSSNFSILAPGIPKRTWSLIWGGIFTLMCFVPNFRHYRVLSFLGIATTTYTAWYMTVQAGLEYPQENIAHSAPNDPDGNFDAANYFSGIVNILFTFGGHSSNIEVADVMDDPATYSKSYFYSFLYVFTLTVPNAISTCVFKIDGGWGGEEEGGERRERREREREGGGGGPREPF
jgi:auxin influx carrier (AUX1 LAX family)